MVMKNKNMDRTWEERAKLLYHGHTLLRFATIVGKAIDDRLACGYFDEELHALCFTSDIMKKRGLDMSIMRQLVM